MVAHVTLCGLLCYVAVLASGDSLPRAMLYHFSPYGVRAISIFYQFIQFLGATVASDGEVRITFISSFHLFADLAKHPAGQLSHLPPAAAHPARPLLHHHLLPWRPSRVGQTYRETKTRNIPSYFIPFIDE